MSLDASTKTGETAVPHLAMSEVDWKPLLIVAALYFFSAALLLVKLGGHPGYTQNWEEYTTWRLFQWWDHPSTRIFHISDGVMLTSGSSPLLAPFIWLSFKLFGVGMFALRLPSALISAAAAPLIFVLGRRLCSARVGILAGLLLALLPSFLVYGRTATNAGYSIVPALITLYVLLRALKEPKRWMWFALLQFMLILGAYAYTPIRLLWPISALLIAVEIVVRRDARWPLALGLAATVIALPLFVVFVDDLPGHDPLKAARNYYVAHGETILTIRKNRENYKYFLQPTAKERAAGHLLGSNNQLMWRLIGQNATNTTDLFLDRHTTRALVDFWNPRGRLYYSFLVPFFLVGLIRSLLGVARRVEDRILQTCFWVWTISLLGVSVVNIGRFVYLFPLICWFVGSGLFAIVDFVVGRAHRAIPSWVSVAAATGAAAALLIATARATWNDYKGPPTIYSGASMVARLNADAGFNAVSGRSGVLVPPHESLEVESIEVSSYRVLLDDKYRFVDISAGVPVSQSTSRKPVLLYGQALDLLHQPRSFPTFCRNNYYVQQAALEAFRHVTASAAARCEHRLRVVEIPT